MPDAWIQQLVGVPEWSEFFDPETIRAWARDARQCLQSGVSGGGHREWCLTGPNIAVECSDSEDGAALLARACLDAGLNFARVPERVIRRCAEVHA